MCSDFLFGLTKHLYFMQNNDPARVGTKFHFTINTSGIFKIFKELEIKKVCM